MEERINKTPRSTEEICDGRDHDVLFFEGELGKDGQRQDLCGGPFTLRKISRGVSQSAQGGLLVERQGIVNL
jgi:hypothetical protein